MPKKGAKKRIWLRHCSMSENAVSHKTVSLSLRNVSQHKRLCLPSILYMTKMHRMSQYPLYMHHRIECVYSAFLKMLPPLFNNENGYQKLRGMLGDTKHAPRVRHQSFHCKKSFPPKLKASPNYGDVHNVR